MCKVVNLYKESYDVYIGRPRSGDSTSIWANPFKLYCEDCRDEIIYNYRKHLWKQIQQGIVTRDMLIALDGKILGCFCKPKSCHGDVIIKAVKWAKGE
jgi:hypothetical protein